MLSRRFPRSLRFILFVAAVALSASVLRAAEPPAQAESRPNILFIILDDWNWNHSGAYGCSWVKTPNFDRVAREGVLFRNCFTSNPKCSPSRASLLTGRATWQLEEAVSHNGIFPRKFAVYPDLLEEAGYAVGFAGKGWAPGDFRGGGFKRNPAGPDFNGRTHQPPTTGISRNDYVANFNAFFSQRPTDRPFCFWLGIFEPHRAYERGSGARFGYTTEGIVVPPYLPDTPAVRSDFADYAVEVEWADRQIGEVLKQLETAGVLENTVVIVTSDNGMPFPYVKGQIHEDAFRMPLAVRWGQAIRPGRVVEDFIDFRDFAPTFLELAGVPRHSQMTGRSFAGLLRASESGWIDRTRSTMLVGKERHDLGRPHDWGYPVRAIRTTEYLYVHNYFPDRWPAGNPETGFTNSDDGPTKELIMRLGGYYFDLALGKRPADELYRLSEDSTGTVNLASDPAYATILAELRERMLAQLRQEEDPRALGRAAVFDSYRYTGSRGNAYDTWLAKQSRVTPEPAPSKREASGNP